jgi:hypothetical protein
MPATPKSPITRHGRGVAQQSAKANQVLAQRSSIRTDRPLTPTVRMCPVDPPLRTLAVLGAATRTLVTTYTDPGDRVLIVEPPVVARAVGSPRRPSPVRLDWAAVVEAVARLGRGASTRPATAWVDPAVPHTRPVDNEPTDPSAEPESGAGHGLDDPDRTIPIAADWITALDRDRPGADRFDLIIAAVGAVHPGHGPVAAWAHDLAPTGTLAVITHGDRTYGQLASPGRDLHRAARMAGLALTDRLILLHEPPPPAPVITDADRTALTSNGHRRIHSTVMVFTPHMPEQTTAEAHNA